MAENKLEMDILKLYDSNLVNLFSINQIASKLGKKYPYINKKVTEMLDRGILNKTVVGKSYLCSLNMASEETLLLLMQLEVKKSNRDSDAEKIHEFIDHTRLSLTIHCVVKFNKKIVFVIEDIKQRRRVQREFSDSVVVDKQEFLDMLNEEQKLFTRHKILYGRERFFELMKIELSELKAIHSPLRY